MQTHSPLISLKKTTKTYLVDRRSSFTAVKAVDLEVQIGEFIIITGRSGSGKTTLLNLIAGLTYPTSGEVHFEGLELWKLPDREQAALRNQKIGFVFQFPSLIPSLTIYENVLLPAFFWHGKPDESSQEKARRLLDEVGLGDRLRAYPRQLSAGEQQRVVVARALINDPELLLADEPTSNLDEQTEHEIMGLLKTIHLERQITILLVTHTTELLPYGTRSLRMASGEIFEEIGLNLEPYLVADKWQATGKERSG
jgi:ABC-type lipoprotein export system ATPase subunit